MRDARMYVCIREVFVFWVCESVCERCVYVYMRGVCVCKRKKEAKERKGEGEYKCRYPLKK